MQGFDPDLKLALFKAKLYKKLDKVSDDLIASCKWELNKAVVIPKSPKAYRKLVLATLDIQEDQLLRLVVEDIKKRSKQIKKSRPPKRKVSEDLTPKKINRKVSSEPATFKSFNR